MIVADASHFYRYKVGMHYAHNMSVLPCIQFGYDSRIYITEMNCTIFVPPFSK